MYHIKKIFIKVMYVLLIGISLNQYVFCSPQDEFFVALKQADMQQAKKFVHQLDIDTLGELLLRSEVDINVYTTMQTPVGICVDMRMTLWQAIIGCLFDNNRVEDIVSLLKKLILLKKIDINADMFVENEKKTSGIISHRRGFSLFHGTIPSEDSWLYDFFITIPDVDINKEFLYECIIDKQAYKIKMNGLSICFICQVKEQILQDLLAHSQMEYATILNAYNLCRQIQFEPSLARYFFSFYPCSIYVEPYVSILQWALEKRRNDFLRSLQGEELISCSPVT